MHRVIIDTDPGVDDALALFVALSHLTIDGITICGTGNHDDVPMLAQNTCRIIELANIDDPQFRIYKGSNKPLEGDYRNLGGKLCHGENGLGMVQFETPKNLHLIDDSLSAEDFIIKTCRAHPREVTIVCLAPFTNLARALQKDPGIGYLAKGVVSMSGVVNHIGNVSPVAEANVANDPHAAKIVFNTPGIHVTLCPLNVTEKLCFDPPFRLLLRESGRIGTFLVEAHDFMIKVILAWGECDEHNVPMHDVTAILAMLFPDAFESKQVFVDVETKGELTAGQLIADFKDSYKKKPQTTLVLDCLDVPRMKAEILSSVRKLAWAHSS